ncbi:Vitamin B12 import ATP-binding protein BtuD [bioreactor metagenome]|uniref:Vitamin B12 import ATP-binding protein BtuD n=1 Tax=bioreactor metagenome TaxID=1076179 RepID=A0A645GGD3_9ZZZZ
MEIFGEKPGGGGGRIGYVPQVSLLDKAFPITVFEVVRTGMLKPGLTPFFGYSKENEKKTSELLQKAGIYALKDRRICELSGGEFQRMLIARALAVDPNLLLLDEPTANVDASSLEKIYKLLEELNQEMTIVLVTHDLLAVSSQVKKLACLNGRMVYHGEPELDQKVVNSLYGCPVDLIAHGVPHRVLKEHKEEI